MRLPIALLICATLAAASLPASPQGRIPAAIAGTVRHSSDTVVSGASAVLKDEGTRAARDTVTNNSGWCRFPDLAEK